MTRFTVTLGGLSLLGICSNLSIGAQIVPDGWDKSFAYDVSSDGRTVVGYVTRGEGEEFESQACQWTDDVPELLPRVLAPCVPGPGQSCLGVATRVSADGSIAAGATTSEWGREAVYWDDEGVHALGYLRDKTPPPDGTWESAARGVSADGSIIVGQSINDEGYQQAFRWTLGNGMDGLPGLPGVDETWPGKQMDTEAWGISGDGSVIVGRSWGYGIATEPDVWLQPVRWTSESGLWTDESGDIVVESLGDLEGDGFRGRAHAASYDGSVIVGFSKSELGYEAFRWTESEGMIGLGDLPGGAFESYAWDVSCDGSVIVGYATSEAGLEAFIWDESNGMRNLQRDVLEGIFGLDLTGWSLEQATGITCDGRTIVGWGVHDVPSPHTEAWLATIPEPSTLALAAFGLIGLLAYGRRRTR